MIKDNEFIKSKNVPGPTKEEIRALIIAKSEASKKDVVMDIGCGTGGISCEIAKIAKKVIAIDKNPEAIEITGKNLKKFNLQDKVELIEDEAVAGLKSIHTINLAIIGGSNNQMNEIIDLIDEKLVYNGKIIVTAILIETKVQALNKLKNLGYNTEIIEVNISKGRFIRNKTMMLAQNPIAIITAIKLD
ncbi:precorrin-6Y C5,15-methyltransferase (decarboxylating) subunit CbiT [Methanobrevibacter filiformis]|uniref:Probable cobalt-precorrin-6B C(15)-methyltransferase (decarboxylating) n=1 Tax=Methanobrevibacter filiformis TaxID=55758 RepID=A0A166AVN0_9EURY|nr:precorrin-6Y C5,15-methyltransferase (decarboxylating) subunit CbiT [Methanobrevibacter filiformis]KZX12524.1 putative cobalt-precorrin-6Y C(15)-methyltransferase [Methanobrevibacter filiformis]